MCPRSRCSHCGSNAVTHHRMRVDYADPSIKVCVLVTCDVCGETVH